VFTRARFVILGAVVVALAYFGPDAARSVLRPLPSAHQPALLLNYDGRRIDEVVGRIEALNSVRRVALETDRTGPAGEPIIYGRIEYDGFLVNWVPEQRFEGFNTMIRPLRPRFAREPDPHRVDAAMRELESLVADLDGGSALFISDAELREVSPGQAN
jgi:hypothetical protein